MINHDVRGDCGKTRETKGGQVTVRHVSAVTSCGGNSVVSRMGVGGYGMVEVDGELKETSMQAGGL